MASKIKTCSHCGNYYERLFDGRCPHCEKLITKRKCALRTCPACAYQFTHAKIINGVRTCINCQVELFYPTGRLKGKTLLLADKEAVGEMLSLLEKEIGSRRRITFAFSEAERRAELFHGYGFILAAKAFLSKQSTNGISSAQLCIKAVEGGLKNGYGNANSLALFRARSSSIFSDAFAAERARLDVANMSESIPDFSVFRPQ